MITEHKLRQIIKQELQIILESRQPTEDLAELYLKLDSLLSFHFGGDQEQQTLSLLNNEMTPVIDGMIEQIQSADLKKINEIFKFLNYFKKELKPKSDLFADTDLQITVKEVKNKLKELENTIFDKRVGNDKEYQNFHNEQILPKIQLLGKKLSDLISSNTRFPNANPRRTKRDILKRLKRRY